LNITEALQRLYSTEFKAILSRARNPYGDGGASERVVQTIKDYVFDGIAKKAFYDLPAHDSARKS
jgi:GDP/UDP-N,N'-diacetylbacillosamine 2-epimerase (hydrolysing)